MYTENRDFQIKKTTFFYKVYELGMSHWQLLWCVTIFVVPCIVIACKSSNRSNNAFLYHIPQGYTCMYIVCGCCDCLLQSHDTPSILSIFFRNPCHCRAKGSETMLGDPPHVSRQWWMVQALVAVSLADCETDPTGMNQTPHQKHANRNYRTTWHKGSRWKLIILRGSPQECLTPQLYFSQVLQGPRGRQCNLEGRIVP